MTPSERPRALLIGKNGQVGWELRRTLAPLTRLVSVGQSELDLTDAAAIRKWVRDIAPQVVVNAAAYTAVDKAEAGSFLRKRCRVRDILSGDPRRGERGENAG